MKAIMEERTDIQTYRRALEGPWLAKKYMGDVYPIGYANLTQARKRAQPIGWQVIGHRPFYVAKPN